MLNYSATSLLYTIKKGRNVSKYLGKLDKEKGFIPKGQNKRAVASPRNITEYFSYHSRLIKCGKRKYNDFYLYLFEDQDLRLEEQKTLYRKLEERKIDKKKFDDGMKKAGKILIVSDMDVEKQEIYLLLKKREVVEKMFETYKTVLNADKLYLQSDESLF